MPEYQISTEEFTCLIVLDHNYCITNSAPLLKRFRGQPLSNLIQWCERSFYYIRILELANNTSDCAAPK